MQEHAAASGQNGIIYCPHCGTRNQVGEYSCVRCGEHLFLPSPDQPPPMGLAACAKCEKPNVSRAAYCVFCGSPMDTAVRMSPAGAAATRNARARDQREREAGRARGERPVAQQEARSSQTRMDMLRPAPVPSTRPEANDSGSPAAQLPSSLKGFNWAAFLVAPLWGLGNAVVPAILLGGAGWAGLLYLARSQQWAAAAVWALAHIIVGYRANEWAWRARKWHSVEYFRRVQQAWLLWAVVISVIVMIALTLFLRGAEA